MTEKGLINKFWILNLGEEKSIVQFIEPNYFPEAKRRFVCEDIKIYVPCLIKPKTKILNQVILEEISSYLYDERTKTLLIIPLG